MSKAMNPRQRLAALARKHGKRIPNLLKSQQIWKPMRSGPRPAENLLLVNNLDEAREVLEDVYRTTCETGGVYFIGAPPGVGKTHAVHGLVRSGAIRTAKVLMPYHELVDQFVERADAPARVARTPHRTRENCDYVDEIDAARRISFEAGQQLCRACRHHPSNNNGVSGCKYFGLVKASNRNVLVTTHQHELETAQKAPLVRRRKLSRKSLREAAIHGHPVVAMWKRRNATDTLILVE
jgi:hypothetical protein